MTRYIVTKTFVTGILAGITTKMTVTFDGPCRFRVGEVVKAIGGGSYRVDAIEVG